MDESKPYRRRLRESVCVCAHVQERQKEGGGEERKIMDNILTSVPNKGIL